MADSTPVNKELRDLGTHMAGATDLHETLETEQPVAIQPPASPNPGPYDVRHDRFKNNLDTDK